MASTNVKWKGWGFIGPGLLWTVAFFTVPLLIMAAYSMFQRVGGRIVTDLSFSNYAAFFSKPHNLNALINSVEVTLITTVISILLAYPLAYILAYRVPARWQRIALMMAILPFWTSYVVRSYSWLLVLSNNGVISNVLQWLGIVAGPISLANSRTATVIGFVHFFTMLLTLNDLCQSGANTAQLPQGSGRSRRFALADFLANHPALEHTRCHGGGFLTIVLTLGDYITPQILGGLREVLLPQAIMLQIQRQADFPMASAMSLVLMVVISIIFLLFSRWLKIERL